MSPGRAYVGANEEPITSPEFGKLSDAPVKDVRRRNIGSTEADRTVDFLIRLRPLYLPTEFERMSSPRPRYGIRPDISRIVPAPIGTEIAAAASVGMTPTRYLKLTPQPYENGDIRIIVWQQ